MTVLAEGFTRGIEGASCDRDGAVYAVDLGTVGTIGRVAADGSTEVWTTLPEGSHGCGTLWDQHGELLVADYTGHNVLRVRPAGRTVSVWAHEPAMSQPNDLAITGSGIVLCSDPDWASGTGRLWRVDADGSVTLLEEEMGTTNGIEVSPGDDILYVNETRQRRVWAYDLDAAGSVSGKRLLVEFDDSGLDGMRCDVRGALHITRPGKGTSSGCWRTARSPASGSCPAACARTSPSAASMGERPTSRSPISARS